MEAQMQNERCPNFVDLFNMYKNNANMESR